MEDPMQSGNTWGTRGANIARTETKMRDSPRRTTKLDKANLQLKNMDEDDDDDEDASEKQHHYSVKFGAQSAIEYDDDDDDEDDELAVSFEAGLFNLLFILATSTRDLRIGHLRSNRIESRIEHF